MPCAFYFCFILFFLVLLEFNSIVGSSINHSRRFYSHGPKTSQRIQQNESKPNLTKPNRSKKNCLLLGYAIHTGIRIFARLMMGVTPRVFFLCFLAFPPLLSVALFFLYCLFVLRVVLPASLFPLPRPYYLQDLVDADFVESNTLGLFVRETIGGEIYTGPENYLLNMTADELQQWNLQGSEQHPFHVHVNHMQFVNVDGPSLVPGWNHVGDWVDTVSSEILTKRSAMHSTIFFAEVFFSSQWSMCRNQRLKKERWEPNFSQG